MDERRVQELLAQLYDLTGSQRYWVEKVIEQFRRPYSFCRMNNSGTFSDEFIENFGEALRIHHCFSKEAFSKDKFEHVVEETFQRIGNHAELASRGNPGHDITVDGERFSLKTQADQNIRLDKIHISKFMELGRGNWGDNPDDLYNLRDQFLSHMNSYDRIFTFRRIRKEPQLFYELVEIPKQLLQRASEGEFEMMVGSRQYPKPGYCRVFDEADNKLFELYFDGGTERKLQIKNLLKEYCIVHATWEFEPPAVITR